MTEIQRVVCPTDFSKFSRRALQKAIALAQCYEAPITALHVLPPPGTGELAAGPGPIILEQTYRQDLNDFVGPARAEGVPTETLLLRGSTAKQIVECAGARPGDLLVMGTHGRGGFQRWILGSVAETVLRRARCPVMTVCAHAECGEGDAPGRFSRILCPVDFSACSATAIDHAFAMAEDCSNGQVTLLHVMDSFPVEQVAAHAHAKVRDFTRTMVQEARAKLEGIIADSATGATKTGQLVARGKAHEEILRTAEDQGSDLIVMGIHGRSALDLMLFGSTAHHVVRGARCPVLTIRAS
jgi:nucleotide-binding universal stress UspA family protein